MKRLIALVPIAALLAVSNVSAAPKTVSVAILPMQGSTLARYNPATISVNVGDTVEWISRDGEDLHNVVIPSLNHFSVPFGRGDADYETFQTAGVYNYYCEPHPYMTGKVIVGDPNPTPAGAKFVFAANVLLTRK